MLVERYLQRRAAGPAPQVVGIAPGQRLPPAQARASSSGRTRARFPEPPLAAAALGICGEEQRMTPRHTMGQRPAWHQSIIRICSNQSRAPWN